VIQNLGIAVHPVKAGNRLVLFLGEKTQNILDSPNRGIDILSIVSPDLLTDIVNGLPYPLQGPLGQAAVTYREQPGKQGVPVTVTVKKGHTEGIVGITGFDAELIYVKGGLSLTGAAQVTVTFYIGIAAGLEIRILQPE
jgi:hypothetical protein